MSMADPRKGPADALVKVAYARDQSEAEFFQGLLRDAGIYSLVRRAPGFDVPEFLAAGPREVLVTADNVRTARQILLLDDVFAQAPRRQPASRRLVAPPLLVAAILVLVVGIAAVLLT